MTLRDAKHEPIANWQRAKANKTAIRYLVYWTLGIIALLAIDMYRRGIVPENWIPMAVALPILLVFGVAYFRTTTRKLGAGTRSGN